MIMKPLTLPFTILFFFVIHSTLANAKHTELNHSFKIVGNKRMPYFSKGACEMKVEYDSASIDHLYLSAEFKKNGLLKTRTRLLFKGAKFDLYKFSEYVSQSKFLVDGLQVVREEKSLGWHILYL